MGALKVLWQMSRSTNLDFRKLNFCCSACLELEGLGGRSQSSGRWSKAGGARYRSQRLAEDGENQEEACGAGKEEGNQESASTPASERKQLREES